MKALVPTAALLLAGCVAPGSEVRAPTVAAPVAPAPAANPQVGGITLPADRTIAANVAAVPTLAMLVGALRTATLLETLNGAGPLTLFAPTDEAFGRLAPGTAVALLKPENRAALTKLLHLHLVPGRLTAAELIRRVQASNGAITLATVAGEPLTVTMTGSVVTLTDSGGNRSYVETADVRNGNGMLHIVNGVLVPRLTQ